jgi:hypothetical protein
LTLPISPVKVTVGPTAIVLNYSINLGGPDTGSITGSANITLGPDGSYNYSGAIHNSNISDYNVSVVFAIGCKSVPTIFSFGVQQSVGGYINPFGSHDWNWGNSGSNGVIKDLWNDLVQGLLYWYKSAANFDLSATWNDVKTEIGYVQDVVAVVGALS